MNSTVYDMLVNLEIIPADKEIEPMDSVEKVDFLLDMVFCKEKLMFFQNNPKQKELLAGCYDELDKIRRLLQTNKRKAQKTQKEQEERAKKHKAEEEERTYQATRLLVLEERRAFEAQKQVMKTDMETLKSQIEQKEKETGLDVMRQQYAELQKNYGKPFISKMCSNHRDKYRNCRVISRVSLGQGEFDTEYECQDCGQIFTR